MVALALSGSVVEEHRCHLCTWEDPGSGVFRNYMGTLESGHLSPEPLAIVRERTVSNCSNLGKGWPTDSHHSHHPLGRQSLRYFLGFRTLNTN